MTPQEVLFATEEEVLQEIAYLVKQRRIKKEERQIDFAKRIGIPLPTYKLFEQSGKCSSLNLIKIVSALGLKGVLIEALKIDNIERMGIDAFMQSKEKTKERVRRGYS